MIASPHIVDARGLLCPWPVLRLTRAVREGAQGSIRVIADDPLAAGEIAALCRERGWRLERNTEDSSTFDIEID
jgi:tRNA 2-thiouridine synthesizing protein A